MKHWRPFLIVLMSLAVVHCSSDTPADALHMTVISASRSDTGLDAAVSFSLNLRNQGDAILYVAECGALPTPWIQVRSGTEWTLYGGGICEFDEILTANAIGPGQSIPASVAISGLGSHPGYYRAVILVSDDPKRLVDDEAAGRPQSADELASSASVYLP